MEDCCATPKQGPRNKLAFEAFVLHSKDLYRELDNMENPSCEQ